jgi:hypothetical protein
MERYTLTREGDGFVLWFEGDRPALRIAAPETELGRLVLERLPVVLNHYEGKTRLALLEELCEIAQ